MKGSVIGLPDDVVVAQLQGGLGNQLFQYAAVGAAARREGRRLLLDTSRLGGVRPYALGHFPIAARVVPADVAHLLPQPHSWLTWLRRPAGINLVVQRGLGFGTQLERLPPRAWVSGYWQSYRYFEHHRDELRVTFSLPSKGLSPRADAYARQIDADRARTVAVHMRRGDYVSNPATAAAHGVLGIEHFQRGLALAREDGGDLPVVFSDDIDWARTHLGLEDALFVDPATGYDHEDLVLLARCARRVLSNSSFSWWGAWLGREGLVVAPARWTRTMNLDEADLLPADWVRL